jgi:hydroxypyruvate reductase
MVSPQFSERAAHMGSIQQAALQAADAGACVHRYLTVDGRVFKADRFTIKLAQDGRLFVVAIGKAAPAMTAVVLELIHGLDLLGLVTLPAHTALPDRVARSTLPATLLQIASEHPLPGQGSLQAGRQLAQMLATTRPADLVLVLLSGGGSAMIENPIPGVSLPDLREANQLLLASGAAISEINAVRGVLSRLKAGGLARMAAPARVLSLILSDVVGNRLGDIASGPTVLRRRRTDTARQILKRHQLWERVPPSIRSALSQPEAPAQPAPRPANVIIGSVHQVVAAASLEARQLGFRPKVITRQMRGEARAVGQRLARRLLRAQPSECLVMGGETTVRLIGGGLGGRNQELALAAALTLEGTDHIALLALGTDGVDGPTDAAGAMVDGLTINSARRMGYEPEQALAHNDSYPLLASVGALIRTGPTGTNLNDLVVGLTYRS